MSNQVSKKFRCAWCGGDYATIDQSYIPEEGMDPQCVRLICAQCKRVHYAIGTEDRKKLLYGFERIPVTVVQQAI